MSPSSVFFIRLRFHISSSSLHAPSPQLTIRRSTESAPRDKNIGTNLAYKMEELYHRCMTEAPLNFLFTTITGRVVEVNAEDLPETSPYSPRFDPKAKPATMDPLERGPLTLPAVVVNYLRANVWNTPEADEVDASTTDGAFDPRFVPSFFPTADCSRIRQPPWGVQVLPTMNYMSSSELPLQRLPRRSNADSEILNQTRVSRTIIDLHCRPSTHICFSTNPLFFESWESRRSN